MKPRVLMYLFSVAVYLALAGYGTYLVIQHPTLQNPFGDDVRPLVVWAVILGALLMAVWRSVTAYSTWKASRVEATGHVQGP
jgi:hypothetical protein